MGCFFLCELSFGVCRFLDGWVCLLVCFLCVGCAVSLLCFSG